MRDCEELLKLSQQLQALGSQGESDAVSGPIDATNRAIRQMSQAFSGSWLGYHSRVYYRDFKTPPPGSHFNLDWGLMDTFSNSSSLNEWIEYPVETVKNRIKEIAGNADVSPVRAIADRAAVAFADAKDEALSIVEQVPDIGADSYLLRLKKELEDLRVYPPADVVEAYRPKGSVISSDITAISQGSWTPPHITVFSEIASMSNSIGVCTKAAKITAKLGSHLERKSKRATVAARVGTNVFIGHGRSLLWRELKDFLKDRLALPVDEFNRVPVAGITNVARLAEMLDAAAVAFLIMTAEDELADGGWQARMNVVHEAGLFQGRLGFTKAILLVEDGCAEFTNVQGLGQIRFPKGNIAASFEEIRRVAEREGLIDS